MQTPSQASQDLQGQSQDLHWAQRSTQKTRKGPANKDVQNPLVANCGVGSRRKRRIPIKCRIPMSRWFLGPKVLGLRTGAWTSNIPQNNGANTGYTTIVGYWAIVLGTYGGPGTLGIVSWRLSPHEGTQQLKQGLGPACLRLPFHLFGPVQPSPNLS